MPTSSRRTHLPVFALISAAVLAGCRGDGTQAQPDSAETTPANSSAAGAGASSERMARAAREFLDALSPQQRADAEFPFDADSERTRGSNLPASMVERAGVRFGDLTDGQRRRFHDLLRASTSSQGYQKIVGVIRLDEVLRGRAGRPAFRLDRGPLDDVSARYYYRVHGPSLLIEYIVEEGVGGDAANHVHSIMRDPGNDYGEDWLGKHYEEHHQRR